MNNPHIPKKYYGPKRYYGPKKHYGLGVGFIIACALVYAMPLLPSGHVGDAYVFIHILLTALMVLIWHKGSYSLSALLWIGLAARVILFLASPITSTDAERYLWDGAVTVAGYDAYSISPEFLNDTPLRALWPTPEEHAQYATIYPPGAISLFAVSALAGPHFGFWVWKLLATGAGIAALFLMARLVKKIKTERHFALCALSPLLILETNVGVHVDSFSVLAVVAALLFLKKKFFMRAGLMIGWGTTLKFAPLIMLGPLLFFLRGRETVRVWFGALFFIALIYGGAFLSGLTPIGVVQVFFEKWRNGSPFFSLFEFFLAPPELNYLLFFIACLLFAMAAFMAYKDKIYEAIALAMAVPFLLSPVVFPWYLMVLIPFLAIRPSATIGLWVSAAPLSYVVLNRWIGEGVWEVSIWPIVTIGVAIIIGVCVDLYRSYRRMGSDMPQMNTGLPLN